MSTLAPEHPRALHVEVSVDAVVVHLEDGRTLSVPLEWFPKLRDASPAARSDLRLIGRGLGIHWPQLDEDLSVRELLTPTRDARGIAPGEVRGRESSAWFERGDNEQPIDGSGEPMTEEEAG